ncbi:MAG: hypothetical protein IJ224_06700 [Lachnospiraceae bacterium]|nr:hypothetical protein [Lachnospiraceae bacterium]
MSNFSKMLEVNKEISTKKEERAIREITKMLDNNIQVTVAELVKRTGLSRAYFYKNPTVSDSLKKAREKQRGISFNHPTKVILDKAMEKQIYVLKKENERYKDKIKELEAEIEVLRKQANKNMLKVIKGL